MDGFSDAVQKKRLIFKSLERESKLGKKDRPIRVESFAKDLEDQFNTTNKR